MLETGWQQFIEDELGKRQGYVQFQQNQVEVWSTKRLPFGPQTGWLIQLRNSIGQAVKNLDVAPAQILHAIYGAEPTNNENYDVENILFYNVGSSAFTLSTKQGLRFERDYSYPEPSQELVAKPVSYHKYLASPIDQGFLYWKVGKTLAQWEGIEISSLKQVEKTWFALQNGQRHIQQIPMQKVQRFGVSITIEIPETYRSISISGSVKELIDGVISSFHVHNGSDIDIVSQRLANSLKVSKDTIRKLLLENEYAILGKRKLLSPYRANIKWNPEDNICLVGEILTKPYRGISYRISGKLFEIEPLRGSKQGS